MEVKETAREREKYIARERKKNVDLMIENEFRHEICKESQTWIVIYMKSLRAEPFHRDDMNRREEK